VEVAVVHRPKYDDWSLPKGKLEGGESPLEAAVREVREELGSEVAASRRIGEVSYRVAEGPKTVTYWVMRHVGGEFAAGPEIDDVLWLRPKDARNTLGYDVDRRIMADFAAVPLPDSVVVLVRHGRAGKRNDWKGVDRERPLDAAGVRQASRLVPLLSAFRPDRIVSADLARCVQTVRPLAQELGVEITTDAVFSDDAFARAPAAAEDAVLALAKPGRVSVVCSQGEAIPGLVERLGRGVRPSDTRKGAFWVLALVDGTVVTTDYYEDALT
jgi:8-oxo-dGTP diphosphatase